MKGKGEKLSVSGSELVLVFDIFSVYQQLQNQHQKLILNVSSANIQFLHDTSKSNQSKEQSESKIQSNCSLSHEPTSSTLHRGVLSPPLYERLIPSHPIPSHSIHACCAIIIIIIMFLFFFAMLFTANETFFAVGFSSHLSVNFLPSEECNVS